LGGLRIRGDGEGGYERKVVDGDGKEYERFD